MTYLVGIDGGGTSCRARVLDLDGKLIAEGRSGSANILLGAEPALDAIIGALLDSGIEESQFHSLYIGAALAGAEQKSAWDAL